MSDQSFKLPVWFWIIAALAVVWNIMGVGAYLADVTMSEEAMAKFSEVERNLYEARPSWLIGAYAVAVFTGLLGAVTLALRKSWAIPLFGVSLVAVIVQMGYVLFGMNVIGILGLSAAAMPAVILIIAAFLLWFSMSVKGKGWLK